MPSAFLFFCLAKMKKPKNHSPLAAAWSISSGICFLSSDSGFFALRCGLLYFYERLRGLKVGALLNVYKFLPCEIGQWMTFWGCSRKWSQSLLGLLWKRCGWKIFTNSARPSWIRHLRRWWVSCSSSRQTLKPFRLSTTHSGIRISNKTMPKRLTKEKPSALPWGIYTRIARRSWSQPWPWNRSKMKSRALRIIRISWKTSQIHPKKKKSASVPGPWMISCTTKRPGDMPSHSTRPASTLSFTPTSSWRNKKSGISCGSQKWSQENYPKHTLGGKRS